METIVQRLQNGEDAQKAFCCMMEVPTPWPEALCQCRDWIARNLGRYVEGYHLALADGGVIGHLYYALSENALFGYEIEPGIGVLYCEWVQRRYQGQGLGAQLYTVFLNEMRQTGVKGLLVEATDLVGQMHYQSYLKRSFQVIGEAGHRKLLYLPLSQAQVNARRLVPRIQPRRGIPIEVVILNGYQCPFDVSTHILLRQIAREFGERVILRDVWLTPEILKDYGASRGIFINGVQKLNGGESEDEIRQAILEDL